MIVSKLETQNKGKQNISINAQMGISRVVCESWRVYADVRASVFFHYSLYVLDVVEVVPRATGRNATKLRCRNVRYKVYG